MSTDNLRAKLGKPFGNRWFGIIAAGVGLGSALVYLWKSGQDRRPSDTSLRRSRPLSNKVVDDRGTGQEEASQILRNLRDRAFEASDEKLAMALGRPVEDVVAWATGREVIDDDVVMKARGIALHRGVPIE
jgi:hypothetical protein